MFLLACHYSMVYSICFWLHLWKWTFANSFSLWLITSTHIISICITPSVGCFSINMFKAGAYYLQTHWAGIGQANLTAHLTKGRFYIFYMNITLWILTYSRMGTLYYRIWVGWTWNQALTLNMSCCFCSYLRLN